MAEAALKQDPPSLGHNTNELTEGEKRALLVNGLSEIESLTEHKDEIVSRIRTSRKRLVAHGFKPKIIDFALRLRKSEDAEEIEQRKQEIEVARFLNHPIGTQPDMFDQPDRTPEVDRAAALGEIAGAEGKTCSSPYVAASASDQAWIKGWHKGQEALTGAFKKLEALEAESGEDESDED